MDHQTLKL